MIRAFKVDVSHVALMALAPDLQADLGPADFQPGIIAWCFVATGPGLKFLDALKAMHEVSDLVAVRDVSAHRTFLYFTSPRRSRGVSNRYIGSVMIPKSSGSSQKNAGAIIGAASATA
jgi:hypothetical protein